MDGLIRQVYAVYDGGIHLGDQWLTPEELALVRSGPLRVEKIADDVPPPTVAAGDYVSIGCPRSRYHGSDPVHKGEVRVLGRGLIVGCCGFSPSAWAPALGPDTSLRIITKAPVYAEAKRVERERQHWEQAEGELRRALPGIFRNLGRHVPQEAWDTIAGEVIVRARTEVATWTD